MPKAAKAYSGQLRRDVNAECEKLGKKPIEDDDSDEETEEKTVSATDPDCVWQKGTNENSIGLLREFYPKGRKLPHVAPAALKRNPALINAGPRKVPNFRSAQELWDFGLSSCCT